MDNLRLGVEELTKKRTPSELLHWIKTTREQIASTEEGEKALLLHEGLAKQLEEELYPLAIFGLQKYGNTDQVFLQPVIGDQSYDAIVTDVRVRPSLRSYLEITQSHEGENDHLRRLDLHRRGFTYGYSQVIKKGTKKTGLQVSAPVQVVSCEEVAVNELNRIVDAAKRKASKDYPENTSLIIVFNDDLFFRKAVGNASLDAFVKKHILNLDLRFSTLYLVGWRENIFRQFSLRDK